MRARMKTTLLRLLCFVMLMGLMPATTYAAATMDNVNTTDSCATHSTNPEHVHTPSDWRTTQVYHYTVCTTCGEFLEQEDHTGGIATCAEKGVCTVCGYAYIEVTENHNPDTSKWTACGDLYHAHLCTLCGAHCDIQDHRWSPRYHAVDASGHAYQCADCKGYDKTVPHNPGPAATETTPQTCKDCGYVIAPVKSHVHDLSKVPQVPATCTEEGNIEYYVCTGCMECFTDPEGKDKIPETASVTVGALGHTTSDTWEYDENHHWRLCTVCDEVLIETQMIHEMDNETCTTCGYNASVAEDTTSAPTETTPQATESQPQAQESRKKTMPWWTLPLIGVGAVGVGIGAGILILKQNKKKE